jgi:P4 family phage/plasmid primase-like protien
METLQQQVEEASELPTALASPATVTSPFEPLHLARMKSRAIDLALAYREGARSVDEVEIEQRVRVPVKGHGLCYDYNHLEHAESCRRYARVHLDDPSTNGKKVVCPPRVTPPPFFMTTAVSHSGPWVIVESAEKALSLASNGVGEAVGLAGVDAGLLSSGTLELQPLARHFIKKGHTVYVMMDAGRLLNARVATAEAKISSALRLHGCDVRLVGLPLKDGGDQGPDDFIAGGGKLEPLIAAAEPGDPAERARAAATLGTEACRALLSELPFACALLLGGDSVIESVCAAMKSVPAVSSDDVKAARTEASAALAQRKVFFLGDQVEIARAVLADLGDQTVHDEGSLYCHDGARWQVITPAECSRAVYKYSGAGVRTEQGIKPLRISAGTASGVVEVLRNLAERTFFGDAPAGVAFAGTFLRVHGRHLVPERPSPEHRARHAYDFRYDNVVRAPRFLALLNEVWDGDSDAESKKALVQEYVGACLVGLGAKLKKVLIFSGDTDSGKSTVLSVLQSVFPPGSVAAVRPSEFDRDYHRAQLVGVLANFVSELPESDWMDPSAFKALTGDDLINARQPYGKPFSFVAKAGHIYAANSLPRINDRSEASWNRLTIVTFNNRFYVDAKDGQRNAVRGLAKEIVESEREGVVAWAVVGLRRLLENSMRLTDVATSESVVNALRNESDQLRVFLDERLSIDPTGNPEVAFTYQQYVEWTRETHHPTLSKSRFGREFTALLRRMTGLREPHSKNSKGKRTYTGVRFQKTDSSYYPFNSAEFVGKS